MTPSPRPSVVRVTARSFHSEQQGQATSVRGNENIRAEVAVYSPVSSDSLSTHQKQTNPGAEDSPSEDTVSRARRERLLGVQGSKITNGDLLAWL
jgi:hypothetical protein